MATWWGVILSEAKDLRGPSALRPQGDKKRGLRVTEKRDPSLALRVTRKRAQGDKKGRSFALLKIGERKEFFEEPQIYLYKFWTRFTFT